MTRIDITRLRLQHHRLIGTPLATPAEVVGWFGAVQAQDSAAARWAVALRTRGAADHDIERACDEGAIDGRVIGTWRRTLTRTVVTVTTSVVATLDRALRAALELAGARYGRFLGLAARLAPAP